MHPGMMDAYFDHLVCNILQSSFLEVLCNVQEKIKEPHVEEFAESFVNTQICSALYVLKNGVLEYSLNLSEIICEAGLLCYYKRMNLKKTVPAYAEDFSLKILGDVFPNSFTYKNAALFNKTDETKHLLTYVEKVVATILGDAFKQTQSILSAKCIASNYCDILSRKIICTAFADIDTIMEEKQQRATNVNISATEQFASHTVQQLFLDSYHTVANKKTSTYSSSSSSLLAVNRRDSCDTTSEAISPHSATDDNNWKKGLYLFADQLLYSLTALESEETFEDALPRLGKTRRVRRWGSCPHILRKPFPIRRDLIANRRKSESVVRLRGTISSFADDISRNILKSLKFTNFIF